MRVLALLICAALLGFEFPAHAANVVGTKAEAVAMVKRVQAESKQRGPIATFKDISDKSDKAYHDRDLYPFAYDMKGECVAHGGPDRQEPHWSQGPGRQVPHQGNGGAGQRARPRLG